MMNLKSLLNANDDGNGNASSKPSPPQHQRQDLPPTTPIQASGPFRDYSNSVHASPRPQLQGGAHEYGTNQHASAPSYASPGGNPYGARPAPPPLQTLSSGSDMRSPSTGSIAGPSPYRQTPGRTGSVSGGYFYPSGPGQSPAVSSPIMHHQGPPQPQSASSGMYAAHRDSYSQGPGPVGHSGPPSAPLYVQAQQQQSMPPHTPLVGAPGGGAPSPYQHQRSHSFQSTPPPQSMPPAQNQHRPLHPSQQPHQQQQQQQQQQQPAPYSSPYGQGSPTVAHHQAPMQQAQSYQQPQHHPQQQQQQQQQPPQPFDGNRQPSTPLGPPLSGGPQRAYSSHQMPQPASPLQQRMPSVPASSSSVHQGYARAQSVQQASPPPPPPSSLPARDVRPSFAHQGSSGVGQPSVSESSHGRSLSQSDRTPSVSVSPKTQVSSLPSSAGGGPPPHGAGGGGSDGAQPAQTTAQAPAYSQTPPSTESQRANSGAAPAPVPAPPPTAMDIDQQGSTTGAPAKRKRDEHDVNADELERHETRRPAPFAQASERPQPQTAALPAAPPPPPPAQKAQGQLPTPAHPLPARPPVPAGQAGKPSNGKKNTKTEKRKRYTEIPVWARTYEGGPLNKPNLILRKPGAPAGLAAGSRHASQHASRHTSPDVSRNSLSAAAAAAAAGATDGGAAGPPGDAAAAAAAAAAAVVAANEARIALLGPWEESITGEKPYEELSRKVADFLFLNVVRNPSIAEIEGLGVQFEIEAKLGTLISKETNQRVALPVASECVLQDTGRWAFRSSMTEAQHRAFNEFLNGLVFATDARNPANAGRAKPRVPVVYKHRREVDRFFELPLELQERLPACVRTLLPPGRRQAVKVRVTTDKKTGAELSKIVKARIQDLNIHFPEAPLDCRISVNLEMAWEGPTAELEQRAAAAGSGGAALQRERAPDRDKDRLSYNQSHYQIDLTQVTYKVQGPNKMERDEKEHELEIELAPAMVLDQGRRAARGEPHAYQELVDGFVDNVRTLARRTQP